MISQYKLIWRCCFWYSLFALEVAVLKQLLHFLINSACLSWVFMRNTCFCVLLPLHAKHRVKHYLPLFTRCTLKDSSSGVRHWSSPYLVLLARLYSCSQWYCPMPLSLQVGERGKILFTATVCSWNLLDRDRRCLVLLLAIFWQLNSLCYWPTFCVQLIYFAISLDSPQPDPSWMFCEALMEEHLKDVC